jgi:hypothetical protein
MQQEFYEPGQQQERLYQQAQQGQQGPQGQFGSYRAASQQAAAFAPVQARRTSTWLAILYMLTALPLGVFYFSFLVAALSTGFSLLVIWIGLPLLYITLLLWLRMAEFERILTMRWLNVYIPSMSPRRYYQAGWWRRFQGRMTNPATWKSVAYLFVKFPFGIFSFTLVFSLYATAIALVLFPVAYLVDTLLVSVKSLPVHEMANIIAYHVMVDGQVHVVTVLVLIGGAILGLGLLYASRYVVRWLSYLWGEFARVMLSRDSYGEPMDASLL